MKTRLVALVFLLVAHQALAVQLPSTEYSASLSVDGQPPQTTTTLGNSVLQSADALSEVNGSTSGLSALASATALSNINSSLTYYFIIVGPAGNVRLNVSAFGAGFTNAIMQSQVNGKFSVSGTGVSISAEFYAQDGYFYSGPTFSLSDIYTFVANTVYTVTLSEHLSVAASTVVGPVVGAFMSVPIFQFADGVGSGYTLAFSNGMGGGVGRRRVR